MFELMRTDKLRGGFRTLLLCAIVGAPATAFAHAYVMQPPPRDIGEPDLNSRAHKSGPCGGIPRTGKPTQYDAGATITVKFEETIAHQGCFQIGFSPANDTNFTTLKQIDDPAGMLGTPITTTVTLPTGVTCPACTLVVRQLMQGTTCPANADPAASLQGTYYSCADICVGAQCDQPDSGTTQTDGGGGDSGAPGTDGGSSGGPATPTDGGGDAAPPGSGSSGTRAPNLHNGDGDGCSVTLGTTSGVSLAMTAALFGLALLRRRRKK